MSKKNRFKKKVKELGDIPLQITSMCDVFMILLVFLLKSFSSDSSSLTLTTNVTLPDYEKLEPIEDSFKLTISENAIFFGDEKIVPLDHFSFLASDLSNEEKSSKIVENLSQAFNAQKVNKNKKLLVVSDKNTPWSTFRKALNSANEAGFEDFKLVFVENE